MHKISSQDFTFLQRVAMEFDTPEALKKYLKEHPGADKSKHSVDNKERAEKSPDTPKNRKIDVTKLNPAESSRWSDDEMSAYISDRLNNSVNKPDEIARASKTLRAILSKPSDFKETVGKVDKAVKKSLFPTFKKAWQDFEKDMGEGRGAVTAIAAIGGPIASAIYLAQSTLLHTVTYVSPGKFDPDFIREMNDRHQPFGADPSASWFHPAPILAAAVMLAAPTIVAFAGRLLKAEYDLWKTASDKTDVQEFLNWLRKHNKEFGEVIVGGDSEGLSKKVVEVMRDLPQKYLKFLSELLQEVNKYKGVPSIPKKATFLRVAMEFDNKEALARYLKEHPGADRNNHSVKKAPTAAPESKPALESVPKQFREHVKEYDPKVMGDDYEQAAEIAEKVKKGISENADICNLSPAICKGNMGLTRDKMPQIPGDKSVKDMLNAVNKDGTPDEKTRAKGKAAVEAGADPEDTKSVLQNMLTQFKKEGVKIEKGKESVGSLKATQSEILAAKTFQFADSHLKGTFANIGDNIVISSDGHILDGHHRWAALLAIDPSRKMNVLRVDMTMKDMLDRADELPGVYREDFKGNPIALPDHIKKRKDAWRKRQ